MINKVYIYRIVASLLWISWLGVGCGGSGQSYDFYVHPFDRSADGSLLPPTQVGTSQIKVIGLRNPSLTESEHVLGVAIRPGTDQVNFSIASVKVGKTVQSEFHDIVVPPGEVLYIEVHYNPQAKTAEREFHRAIVEVTFGVPKPGIVHIEVTGRAEGELPPPLTASSECEVAACIFEPLVTIKLSSTGVPDPPPPPKTVSFSGPILIREEGGELVLDGLEFPNALLTFTPEEIGEQTAVDVKIVLDGAEGAKGKVVLGEDGSIVITDFKVRVRLFTKLEGLLQRNFPPPAAEGEVEGITFTTDTVSATDNKDPPTLLSMTGQKVAEDGTVTIVVAMTLPTEVFTKGPLSGKSNQKLGGGALTAEITGKFEKGLPTP